MSHHKISLECHITRNRRFRDGRKALLRLHIINDNIIIIINNNNNNNNNIKPRTKGVVISVEAVEIHAESGAGRRALFCKEGIAPNQYINK